MTLGSVATVLMGVKAGVAKISPLPPVGAGRTLEFTNAHSLRHKVPRR